MENLPVLSEQTDLAIHREPALVLEEAKKAAQALSDVISGKKKPVIINGEQYLEFEDWMTVARFYGITAKVISTAPITFGDVQGFEARAVALLVITGEEISAAEAMCLNDESNWKNRPLFMLRSMAQTRACAKALRNVLSWVVVLAGYKPTPAEEMEGLQTKPPLQEPQKKNGDASKTDTQKVTTQILNVTQKDGKDKGGKSYTIYTITGQVGEDQKGFKTFDKKIMETALKAKGTSQLFEIEYKISQYGNDIVSMAEPGDMDAQT